MKTDVKELEKKIKSLGIINIEADGDLSENLLQDAIEAVELVKLDFASLKKESEELGKKAQ